MKMSPIARYRIWRAPALLAMVLASGATLAAPSGEPSATAGDTPYGTYLAGRHAQEVREYAAAATWFENSLHADPKSSELISRTFLMEAYEGNFDRAIPLAQKALTLDPSDAVANLVLLVDRIEAGDKAGALARAQALPSDGLYRYAGPPAVAWVRIAMGDLAGADAALQGLDKFDGLAPLEFFQRGLIDDFAGDPNQAEENFQKALDATGKLNWRLTDAMANFYARHGRADKAQAIYRRFIAENAGSELAESALSVPAEPPAPIIDSPREGLAEAFFDLASVANRPETIDVALLYDRCALALRPQFAVAQLLLADIMSAEDKPQESLAVLAQIPPSSPYSWSAQLRVAANLQTLDRGDEAIAMLRKMAAAEPKRAAADMQLGDLLREKKRFVEAAAAYDEAIKRLKAAGTPERWSLYYSRGIALERAGQWQRAEADLQHALELEPDQPLVLNYLGYSWIDRGEKLRRGLKMIEKAVELRPEDGYIVDSLGWAHYKLGNYSAAVQYLEKALELVPEDPTINDHLGDAYWQAGRSTEARYQWRRALQFGPDKGDIKPIEAKLDGAKPPTRAGGG